MGLEVAYTNIYVCGYISEILQQRYHHPPTLTLLVRTLTPPKPKPPPPSTTVTVWPGFPFHPSGTAIVAPAAVQEISHSGWMGVAGRVE